MATHPAAMQMALVTVHDVLMVAINIEIDTYIPPLINITTPTGKRILLSTKYEQPSPVSATDPYV
jgi:hypothetical protein